MKSKASEMVGRLSPPTYLQYGDRAGCVAFPVSKFGRPGAILVGRLLGRVSRFDADVGDGRPQETLSEVAFVV
jgi:hypothetical protein